MSFLRGSVNYVWCTTNVLGKGATGAVFQGVHKNTGEPVAVKTFNQLGQMRPPDVQVREFEVLKKVKHENIVKLLAIEEEQEGRGKVIVMELCTGGSLYNILDDPENTYGLQEEEFLLVVEHLTAGMKHLRDNNLIHRDLKPGNIMKFVAEDGSTIYKLTDFGAARELQEDQQFVSLYGTEEYLHPDMYERAVLRKPVGKTFGATVDLWSIGVTLYHVATGQLPFRPYGGRRNKETMYYITTKKASGVISGCQSSENGPVDWGRELPQNCRLSLGLRKVVTPLLAGLLEADPQRMWSFDRFFSEVTGVLSRRPLHVFHANRTQSVRVYLHPEDLLDQFRALVAEQTDVAPTDQLLLVGDRELSSVVADSTPGRAYPSTSADDPVVLFSRDNNNVCVSPETDRPKFPAFPAPVSVENDAGVAKVACAVGYASKRKVEKLTRTGRLVHAGVERFTTVVCAALAKLSDRCGRLCEVAAKVRATAETAARAEKTVETLLERLGGRSAVGSVDWPSELAVVAHELTANLAPAVRQLHRRYVTDGALKREWSAATRCLPSPTNPPARASTIVERLRDSWQHLLRDRAARSLSYNEEQFHALERIKVVEAGRRMRSLLDTECAPIMAQLADCLADWYKMAQTVYLQTQILDKDLHTFEGRLEDFCLRMSEGDSSFHVGAGAALGPAGEYRSRRKTLRGPSALRMGLEDARVAQEEMAVILRENTNLINQFRELLSDVEGDMLLT